MIFKPSIIVPPERLWRPLRCDTLESNHLVGFGAIEGSTWQNLIVPTVTPSVSTAYGGDFTVNTVFESSQKLVASGGTKIRLTIIPASSGGNLSSVTGYFGNITNAGSSTGDDDYTDLTQITVGASSTWTMTAGAAAFLTDEITFPGLISGRGFGCKFHHTTWNNVMTSAAGSTTGNRAYHVVGSSESTLSVAQTDVTSSRQNFILVKAEVFA